MQCTKNLHSWAPGKALSSCDTYGFTTENECLTKKKKKIIDYWHVRLSQMTIGKHTDSNFASDYYN